MLRIEIDGYLSQQVFESSLVAKDSANPLLFWEDIAVRYPMLQPLAALFFGMSAGSVPVEWLFSVTGLICNSRRSRICPSKLNKISFFHDNLDYIGLLSVCHEKGHELVIESDYTVIHTCETVLYNYPRTNWIFCKIN